MDRACHILAGMVSRCIKSIEDGRTVYLLIVGTGEKVEQSIEGQNLTVILFASVDQLGLEHITRPRFTNIIIVVTGKE